MSFYITPIIWVKIPCLFNKLKPKGEPDLSDLGIPSLKDDYEESYLTVNVDRIDGYTELVEEGQPNRTVFWAYGYRYWSTLTVIEFDKLIKENTVKLNKMLGFSEEINGAD